MMIINRFMIKTAGITVVTFFLLVLYIPMVWGENARKMDEKEIVEEATDEIPSIGSHTEFVDKGESQVTKSDGDSAYIRSDYATAIQIYEQLLEEGEAAEIYYNLGNSYYKIDDIAHAIINYERALLLQPDNADIRANLEIARAKTIDKIIAVPQIFFVSWIHSLINCLSADGWAKLAIVVFILFLLGLSLYFFSKRIGLKKIGLASALLFLCIVIVFNLFASQQKSKLINRNRAIVVSPSVTVRSTPSESGTGLFILHEGCKVEIKDNSMQEWKEITLEDGKVGWIPLNSIEII